MEYLNKEHILLLTKEVGVETTPILLTMFTEELSDYQQILSLYIDNDAAYKEEILIDSLKKISHELKSSASSFGADKLFLLASKIDERAKSNQLSDGKEEQLEMLDTINETLQYYLNFLQ